MIRLGAILITALILGSVSTPSTPLVATPGKTINGTAGDDRLDGTARTDLLRGFGGDDIIHALGSNDVIDAGRGDDLVVPGAGDDTVRCGRGEDVLVITGERNDGADHWYDCEAVIV